MSGAVFSHHSPSLRQGFSLLELSIGLVIIGLMTGGVMQGTVLLRNSKVNSIVTDYSNYTGAVKNFKDQYGELPGDFSEATNLWDEAASGTACKTTTTNDMRTCNGDGNGKIDLSASSNELFRFWQHLANAKLIRGQFSGITAPDSDPNVVWVANESNAPKGELSGGLWHVAYIADLPQVGWNTPDLFNGSYGNIMEFGTKVEGADPLGGILEPLEIMNIDEKMDDGRPATGSVRVRSYGTVSRCTNTANTSNLTATYDATKTGRDCAAFFPEVF